MWLFTSNSFVSIVGDDKHPHKGDLLVRARFEGDIEELFPQAKVFAKTPSDYKYRAWVSRAEVEIAVANYIDNIDYDNFKNSVADDNRHDDYVGVWQVMYQSQKRSSMSQLNDRFRFIK